MEIIIHWFERLLMTSLEATLMVGVLLLFTTVFRRRLTPIWRYAVWILLIVKLMLPWFPGNLMNDFHWIRLDGMMDRYMGSVDRLEVQDSPNLTTDQESLPSFALELAVPNQPSVIPTMETVGGWAQSTVLQIAALIWLLGAVVTMFYIVVGHLKMCSTLRKETDTIVPSELVELFTRIRNNSGIRSRVSLKITSVVDSPALFGLISPIVLIPRNLLGQLDSAEWECVFRHELVHHKRLDLWINTIFVLLTAAHWFNPAIWYAMRHMRTDQEAACDASVLTSIGLKETYARCIVKILEVGVTRRVASTGIGFSNYKNSVYRRIVMIQKFQRTNKRTLLFGVIFLTAVALITLPPVFAEGKLEKIDPTKSSNLIESVSDQPIDEQEEMVVPTTLTTKVISFIMPTTGRISSQFGYRIHPISKEQIFHDGIDIANKEGTDVYAAAAGNVVMAEYDPVYGFTVVLEHNDSWRTEYRHFQELKVTEGEPVEANALIGLMGSTGQSTGSHLQFSILKDGEYVDPAPLLGITME